MGADKSVDLDESIATSKSDSFRPEKKEKGPGLWERKGKPCLKWLWAKFKILIKRIYKMVRWILRNWIQTILRILFVVVGYVYFIFLYESIKTGGSVEVVLPLPDWVKAFPELPMLP